MADRSQNETIQNANNPQANRNEEAVARVLQRSKNAKVMRTLRTRLQFAAFKVIHGWSQVSANDVPSMYLKQQDRRQRINATAPYPAPYSLNRNDASPYGQHSSTALHQDPNRDSSPETVAAELILSFKQSPSPFRHTSSSPLVSFSKPPNSNASATSTGSSVSRNSGSSSSGEHPSSRYGSPGYHHPSQHQHQHQHDRATPLVSVTSTQSDPLSSRQSRQGNSQHQAYVPAATSSSAPSSTGSILNPVSPEHPHNDYHKIAPLSSDGGNSVSALSSILNKGHHHQVPVPVPVAGLGSSQSASQHLRPPLSSYPYQYPFGNDKGGLALIAGAASEV